MQNQPHWAKVMVSTGLGPPGGSEKRLHFLTFVVS